MPTEASLPVAIFSPPQNDAQWKRALHDVKWLLFNQQYKQCASRCNQLIDTASHPLHPIRATYLHYYAATSYEYMGRAAHIYSAVKIPLLIDALNRFQIAYDSLPPVLLPVRDPDQTYSPISRPSPTPSSRSPVTATWSPVLSPAPEADSHPGPSPSADSLSAQNLSAHNTSLWHTPTFLLDPSPSGSPSSSITTAFCVTPSPVARTVPRVNYSTPPPVFHIQSPTRDPPSPPHGISSGPAAIDQLVSFDSARNGLPSGGSIVRSIARMIDNSVLTASDDPFMTRAPSQVRPPMQAPVRLSPIKFPADLKDPVKQSELIPAPLAIRKHSGEMLMCRTSAMVICNDPMRKSLDREVKRPNRVRPPRLPFKVIPSANLNTDTEKPSSSILAPKPRRVSPLLFSPVSMPMPISAPKRTSSPKPLPAPSPTVQPTVQKRVPVLGSPFTTPQGSPVNRRANTLSSWSTMTSPALESDQGATDISHLNNTVRWLTRHIPEDVAELRKQIKHVADIQQARRTRNAAMSRSASFWTFSPIKPNADSTESTGFPQPGESNIDEYGNVLRVETKAQRIQRLRKEGWVIGFRSKHSLWKGPEYYDKLCETALAELAPTGMGSREWQKR
ncbi:hypothetical protein N7457_008782 [Penicillium paradoxum]|uniref:uncharacterized protein n=1 Tax=Penicillium paradoxum TaxID=176176 RepID=UPI002548FB9A|nr:uncharacterized protein N7457_008782 [Penicillium paradoxum]KAJ5773886.1 hypothetical protein N7457_008782 [Penicillium paradoxum]